MIQALPPLQILMVRAGIPGQFRCWRGCASVRAVVLHAVRGGARIPSREDRGQFRVMLIQDEQHGALGDVLEGSLEV